jgi:hypothetical protein
LLQGICAQFAAHYPSIEKQMTSVDRRSLFLVRELRRQKEIMVYVFKRMRTLGPDQPAFSGIAWRRALNGGFKGRSVGLNIPGRSGQQ